MFSKIRHRLLSAFLAVALIPALSLGIYAMQVTSGTLIEQEIRNQANDTAKAGAGIRSFLDAALGDAQFLSQCRPLRALLRARGDGGAHDPLVRELEEELLALANHRAIYYQVRYLDEHGREVARVDRKDGTVAIVPRDRLQDKSSTYYFKNAAGLPAGQVFVSNLDLNREHGQVEVPHNPVIRYVTPVRLDSGESGGVVVLNVDAAPFLRALGSLWLVDRDGFYLAHPDEARRWGGKSDLGHGASLARDLPDLAPALTSPGARPADAGDLVLTPERVAVPGSDRAWTLLSVRLKADLLTGVADFQAGFLAILISALVLSATVAWILDRRISRPIEYLTAKADRVSTGELLDPVEIDDRTEIGRLAEAFERMRVSMARALARRRGH